MLDSVESWIINHNWWWRIGEM